MEILREAAEAAGMPPGALQVIPDRAHEVTHYLFKHPQVDFIWVTGGPKIVALANAAGKPGLSVGPGNAPIYLHKTADLRGAVVDILISKTFDASVICPAEQTCIVDTEVYDELVGEFQRMGAHLLTPEQVGRAGRLRVRLAATRSTWPRSGQQAPELAVPGRVQRRRPAPRSCSHRCPTDLDRPGRAPAGAGEADAGAGAGPRPQPSSTPSRWPCWSPSTAGSVTPRRSTPATRPPSRAYALAVRTGRILVNAPTAVGALGGVYNNLTPTFSLGCGTWGGSSTTENVNYLQLLNIKTVSYRRTPPQWFRVPSNTFFNAGALDNLRDIECEVAVVVTDAQSEARGVVDLVRSRLRTRHVQVWSEVEPEPDEESVRRGVAVLDRARPDLVVAVGGGSVIDAAKAMRLFHEHPEKTLDDLTLPFLDPRKRVADYPRDAHTVRLVAVPTTSGTGSEVPRPRCSRSGEHKETLVDYSLVPDVAIVDPLLTLSMPPSVTLDSGIDALTHALEAAVSIFASPYTDAFCVQSARLIFDALPRVYDDPDDLAARTDMANAATLAGLAFSNAFVGTNHALAHAVGARFGIAHGRANGVFLPHLLRYNAGLPSKFMPAPGYSAYVAPDKYAQLGRVVFGGHEPDENRRRLFQGVEDLLDRVGMPRSLRALGVDEDEFRAALPELAMSAFGDLSNRTNPRMPLVSELTDLLLLGYDGERPGAD